MLILKQLKILLLEVNKAIKISILGRHKKIVNAPTSLSELERTKYSEKDIAYVRAIVSFNGPISGTLMDFWISYRDRKKKEMFNNKK